MFVWLFFAIAGLVIIAAQLPGHVRYRAIRRATTSPAGNIAALATAEAMGTMPTASGYEVVGTAEPGSEGALRAPLSDTTCVWYRVVVVSYRRVALQRLWHGTWTTGRTSPHPFVLRDGSGSVLVAPEGKRSQPWAPSFSRVERAAWAGYQPRNTLAGRVQRLSGTHGSLALQPGTPYEFLEWTLVEGDRVYVLGRPERQTTPAAVPQLDVGKVVLRVPRKGPYFIAKGDERVVIRQLGKRVAAGYAYGFATVAVGTALVMLGHSLGILSIDIV